MIGDKQEHFQGKGTDLGASALPHRGVPEGRRFHRPELGSELKGVAIQAKKGGFLRGVVDADRAMTITTAGSPDDFTVRIGIGKWLEHLGVAAIETLLISELFLVVDVADSAWNVEIEDKLVKNIKSFVG